MEKDYPGDYYTQAIELEKQMNGYVEMVRAKSDVREILHKAEMKQINNKKK